MVLKTLINQYTTKAKEYLTYYMRYIGELRVAVRV